MAYLPPTMRQALAEYRATGLTPEEIEKLKAEVDFDHLKEIWGETPVEFGVAFDRLRELLQAKRDGRLVVLPVGKARWIKAILAERERQNELWGSPQENTYAEWASILSEEVGELCKELNELNFGRGDQDRMAEEAVQVAAVALSILEQVTVAKEVSERVAVALDRIKGGGWT